MKAGTKLRARFAQLASKLSSYGTRWCQCVIAKCSYPSYSSLECFLLVLDAADPDKTGSSADLTPAIQPKISLLWLVMFHPAVDNEKVGSRLAVRRALNLSLDGPAKGHPSFLSCSHLTFDSCSVQQDCGISDSRQHAHHPIAYVIGHLPAPVSALR